MTIWSNKHKQNAAEAIIATRDLCGDEYVAVKQYADDHNLMFPVVQYNAIMYMADKMWKSFQEQANVNPKYYK